MIKLEELSEQDFNALKEVGLLWELYPNAPEIYDELIEPKL